MREEVTKQQTAATHSQHTYITRDKMFYAWSAWRSNGWPLERRRFMIGPTRCFTTGWGGGSQMIYDYGSCATLSVSDCIVNYRPILSSERVPYMKTDWPSVCKINFELRTCSSVKSRGLTVELVVQSGSTAELARWTLFILAWGRTESIITEAAAGLLC
jgi:hypothetical protein